MGALIHLREEASVSGAEPRSGQDRGAAGHLNPVPKVPGEHSPPDAPLGGLAFLGRVWGKQAVPKLTWEHAHHLWPQTSREADPCLLRSLCSKKTLTFFAHPDLAPTLSAAASPACCADEVAHRSCQGLSGSHSSPLTFLSRGSPAYTQPHKCSSHIYKTS